MTCVCVTVVSLMSWTRTYQVYSVPVIILCMRTEPSTRQFSLMFALARGMVRIPRRPSFTQPKKTSPGSCVSFFFFFSCCFSSFFDAGGDLSLTQETAEAHISIYCQPIPFLVRGDGVVDKKIKKKRWSHPDGGVDWHHQEKSTDTESIVRIVQTAVWPPLPPTHASYIITRRTYSARTRTDYCRFHDR